jgi:alkanesulfonate monooxygenase SsuD/methylene tetrahydromethanopterin reductase-like flavin-dependent oxidoreductase (luciferase family)
MMKIGIEIDWERRHYDMPRARVELADKLGYDMVFTAEAHGSDGLTPLGYVLGATKRIGVGTRIIQNVSRPAPLLAMTYQTLRYMAPEREIIAGLGSGNPEWCEGWHGQAWTPAYWRMRDYVAIMRKAFANEPVAHEGRAITIPYHAPGEPPKYQALAPLMESQGHIPIIFGGATELMMTLAGEIADGFLPNGGWWPGAMKFYGPIIDAGLAKRKTPMKREDFPSWAHVDVVVTDDLKAGFAEFKEYVARYTAAGPEGGHTTLMEARGYGHVIPRVQELYRAGKFQESYDAIPDEYIDDNWLIGPLPRVVERWRSKWINDGCNLIVRTDNWPNAKPANNEVYEPLYRALRD